MGEDRLSIDDDRPPAAVAETLRSLADDLDGGESIRVEGDGRTASVALADFVSFELDVERGGEGGTDVELELELEWTEPTESIESDTDASQEAGSSDRPADPVDDSAVDRRSDDDPAETESLGEFQVFTDRAGEWRWRLVHRNGNVIATSGEGYTRRHNAEKGMRSVIRNAPGADVVDDVDSA